MKTFDCKGHCAGTYTADVPESPADWAPEDWGKFMDAQSEHVTPPRPEINHIRKQAAHKWGDTFYAPTYSPSENGSQTLCGTEPTIEDMTWGETRHASRLAEARCARCRELRAAGEGAHPTQARRRRQR